jgi:hypothetical protein
MKNKSEQKIEMSLSSDEARLIRFYRCLSKAEKSSNYQNIASTAFEECLPGERIESILYRQAR